MSVGRALLPVLKKVEQECLIVTHILAAPTVAGPGGARDWSRRHPTALNVREQSNENVCCHDPREFTREVNQVEC